MSRVPTPLTWKRRSFAVLEQLGITKQWHARAVTGIVAGPFAIHASPFGGGSHTLLHLPTQCELIDLPLQLSCRHAAERFAACDVNWWTCFPEEVAIGPDAQELKNIYESLKPNTSVPYPWPKGEEE